MFKFKVEIYDEFCKECGICIVFCPVKALSKSERRNSRGFHPPEVTGKCNRCGMCELLCPDYAIAVYKS